MTMEEQAWTSEKKRLEQVKNQIEEEIQKLGEIAESRHGEALEIRRNFWDEVTVNMSDYTEIAETAASIRQQQAILSEQERSFRHAEQNLKKCIKLIQCPYFGRVDFTEQGQSEKEQIYIGVGSFVDEDTHELLIYDWRAPISALFYDYTPGPAQYKTPAGIIEGEISLKRQYIIKNGRLENMFDTGIQIGDEMLQVMLAKSVHEKMNSIVTTIQKEQNQIIRDDQFDILIVQGAAGSGKTSVALQRVAYLLYRFRHSLSSDNMVLFSPNSVFNDYVSNVLPELGEANMLQTTFQDHLDRGIGKSYEVEDSYDQLEYLLSGSESDPGYLSRVKGIGWKTSISFMKLVDNYVDQIKSEGILFHPIILRDKVLIRSEQLEALFYQEYGHDSSIHSRVVKLKEWILDELEKFEEKLQRHRFRKLVNHPRYMGTDAEMKAESRQIARKTFAPLRKQTKKLGFLNIMGMYQRLFTASFLPHHFEDVSEYTIRKLKNKTVCYEDATPFLYFKKKFEGMDAINQIKQVIIDEAQDYSPFQLEYLRKLFPRAKFTILGDLNQGIYQASVQSYQRVEDLFENEKVGIFRMTKSYRSTTEITQFTHKILQQPEPIEPIGRHGDEPSIIPVDKERLPSKVVDHIHEMLSKGMESIAIICKTAKEAKQAYDVLKEKVNDSIHLITKESLSFKSGVLVIPVYLAKGLEFDVVIIFNAGRDVYQHDQERKLLYTACTRALHNLLIFYVGELSPLIPFSSSKVK